MKKVIKKLVNINHEMGLNKNPSHDPWANSRWDAVYKLHGEPYVDEKNQLIGIIWGEYYCPNFPDDDEEVLYVEERLLFTPLEKEWVNRAIPF